jgi:hypothetical protein
VDFGRGSGKDEVIVTGRGEKGKGSRQVSRLCHAIPLSRAAEIAWHAAAMAVAFDGTGHPAIFGPIFSYNTVAGKALFDSVVLRIGQ